MADLPVLFAGDSDQSRARVMGASEGRVNLYAEHGTGRLLGGGSFGSRAEHTAHLIAWSIERGMTVQWAVKMPSYHPVIEQGVRAAFRDAAV